MKGPLRVSVYCLKRTTMSEIGSLEEEAIKRRERLEALKRGNRNNDEGSTNASESNKASLPKPQFRSYIPQDVALKERMVKKVIPETVNAQVKDQLERSSADVVEEIDLSNLAPRKMDWDLKRAISSKLEKLDRRTQRAVADLIRERLKNSTLSTENAQTD